MRELLIANGSARLAVRDHGGGGRPAVLLVHGIRGTAYAFVSFRPSFEPDHRVVELELRGHGRSTGGSWSWEAAVSDVESVVEHLRIADAAVVGFSLGGIVAACYAAAHREASAVVNVDGYGFADLRGHDTRTEQRIAELHAFRRGRVGRTLTQEELDAQLAHAAPGDEREAILRRLRRLADGTWQKLPAPELELAILDSIATTTLTSLYERIECPLLTVLSLRPDAAPRADLSWVPELHGAQIAALQAELRRLSAAHPNQALVEVDVPHHELLVRPEIATAVRNFVVGSV